MTPFATNDNTITLPSQLRCATLLAAPRWCAACGHGIAADKGNSFVRHARTAHRAAAHYAWLTLKEGGKNSHRPLGSLCEGAGWAAKLHRLRELLPPPLRGTSLGEGGENSHRPCAPPPSVREARLYGVPAVNSVREEGYLPLRYPICAYLRFCGRVRQRAPKCCHLRAVERNRTQSQWRTLGFSSPHGISFCQFKKKFVNIFTPPSPATAA